MHAARPITKEEEALYQARPLKERKRKGRDAILKEVKPPKEDDVPIRIRSRKKFNKAKRAEAEKERNALIKEQRLNVMAHRQEKIDIARHHQNEPGTLLKYTRRKHADQSQATADIVQGLKDAHEEAGIKAVYKRGKHPSLGRFVLVQRTINGLKNISIAWCEWRGLLS